MYSARDTERKRTPALVKSSSHRRNGPLGQQHVNGSPRSRSPSNLQSICPSTYSGAEPRVRTHSTFSPPFRVLDDRDFTEEQSDAVQSHDGFRLTPSNSTLHKWKKTSQRLETTVQELLDEKRASQGERYALKDKIRQVTGKNDHLSRQLRELKSEHEEQKVAAKYSEYELIKQQRQMRSQMTKAAKMCQDLTEMVVRLEDVIKTNKLQNSPDAQEMQNLETSLAELSLAHKAEMDLRCQADNSNEILKEQMEEAQALHQKSIQDLLKAESQVKELESEVACTRTDVEVRDIEMLENTFRCLEQAHAQKEKEARQVEEELRASVSYYEKQLSRVELRGEESLQQKESAEREVAKLKEDNFLIKETLIDEIEQLRRKDTECKTCVVLRQENQAAATELKELGRLHEEGVRRAVQIQADMEEEIARNSSLNFSCGFHQIPQINDFIQEPNPVLSSISEE